MGRAAADMVKINAAGLLAQGAVARVASAEARVLNGEPLARRMGRSRQRCRPRRAAASAPGPTRDRYMPM
eukprot:7512390-Pyramimonas_sp.AAC.1